MTQGSEIDQASLPGQGDPEKQCICCKTHSLCSMHSPSNSGTGRTLSRILGSRGRSRFFERSESPRFKPKPGHLSPQPESESSNEDRQPNNNTNLSIGWRATIELSSFLAAITVFISTLVIPSLRQQELWGLKYWEWALMVLVVLCHRLITVSLWIVSFLINLRFPLHLKVLNLVFGLKKTICNFLWIALVLLSWYLIFLDRIKKSACIHRISRILIVILVASVIWFFKILLVRVLASNFYKGTFFDRMQERFFHHYILQALDSDQLTEKERKKLEDAAVAMALKEEFEGKDKCKMNSVSRLEKFASLRIHRERLRRLMSHVKENGLSTLELDSHGTMEFWKTESKITSKEEAREFATKIFEKVIKASQKKEEEKEFIEKKDLLMFLSQGEVCMIKPLFKGHIQDGKIKKSAFQNWIVEAYGRHKKLDYALEDTKKVVKNLDRLANVFAVVIIIIISFIVMGVPINSVLLVSSSQLLLFGFIFQNSCKIMFESIIFVFVMHPFDIGDHCVIDGVQMIVEEMNILSTVFLGLNKDRIQYPNTELLTKTIINYNRSPDMGETIEIEIDVSNLEGPVEDLWKSIKENHLIQGREVTESYIASNPDYWHPKYQLLVKEIKDGSQMKVNLHVTHAIKFQNYLEKNSRRSDLYSGLKKSLETHKIKYHILSEKLKNEHSKKA